MEQHRRHAATEILFEQVGWYACLLRWQRAQLLVGGEERLPCFRHIVNKHHRRTVVHHIVRVVDESCRRAFNGNGGAHNILHLPAVESSAVGDGASASLRSFEGFQHFLTRHRLHLFIGQSVQHGRFVAIHHLLHHGFQNVAVLFSQRLLFSLQGIFHFLQRLCVRLHVAQKVANDLHDGIEILVHARHVHRDRRAAALESHVGSINLKGGSQLLARQRVGADGVEQCCCCRQTRVGLLASVVNHFQLEQVIHWILHRIERCLPAQQNGCGIVVEVDEPGFDIPHGQLCQPLGIFRLGILVFGLHGRVVGLSHLVFVRVAVFLLESDERRIDIPFGCSHDVGLGQLLDGVYFVDILLPRVPRRHHLHHLLGTLADGFEVAERLAVGLLFLRFERFVAEVAVRHASQLFHAGVFRFLCLRQEIGYHYQQQRAGIVEAGRSDAPCH